MNTYPPTTQPVSVASLPALAAGANSIGSIILPKITRSDTFTSTTNGTTMGDGSAAYKHWSIQVKGTGGVASVWIVIMQVSLDGTNWTTGLTHSSAGGASDGAIVSTTTPIAALYARAIVTSLTLGLSASSVVSTILGTQ